MPLTKERIGKHFPIICTKSYEFEGREFKEGEISYNSWGRNVPDKWRKLTDKEYTEYINQKQQ